jgi:hypothetical protein
VLVVAVVVVTDVVVVVVIIGVVVTVVDVERAIVNAIVVAMTVDPIMNATSKDITIHKQEQRQSSLRLNFVNY